jgi:uncharacterized surface protein with fasciclin (FAS1) repeats
MTRASFLRIHAVALAGVLLIAGTAVAQDKNIVTTAADAGAFNTLLTAATAAGLDGALAADGPFTVFAPTDEAFAKLPEGTIEALLEDTEQLKAILTYHVVSGKKMAADVAAASHLETLNGQPLHVTLNDGAVELGGAQVVQTDIDAGNGVIHVIDSVMLPPSE